MKPGSKDHVHLFRMAGLFVAGTLTFLLLRWLMVPEGFGLYGHYRAGALNDNMATALTYAGQAACIECHPGIAEIRAKGRHVRVACEACHGALARHASQQDDVKPKRPNSRKACIACHTASISKPKAFPQIDPAEHAPEGPCTQCHVQAHNPKIS